MPRAAPRRCLPWCSFWHGDFPILIITGETSSDALRLANERSYTLLQKPIAPEVLCRAIMTALAMAGSSCLPS
jgi:hypothetical protein